MQTFKLEFLKSTINPLQTSSIARLVKLIYLLNIVEADRKIDRHQMQILFWKFFQKQVIKLSIVIEKMLLQELEESIIYQFMSPL